MKEQIDIYRNASFIIGPHGASFTNIMFCKPGTFLYELVPTSWAYDYFLYIVQIMKMEYAAFKDDSHPDISEDYYDALHQDLSVSIPKLQESLEKILGKLH
ncbi:glycosyltransferase 61 family protein [Niabella hibiscisoli]|uniref:glycosyltransferase 61 family protein n=1 Tax=Niabella hibiscisoli TaxID=1825928 RepID=UPI001F116609|nr:glycosyltransferase family 61 protein [Niabella hibiscisoli]MCH5719562.1 glycosyltransferase family 61 protein [Niabella hibiscisoli]